MYTMMSHEGEKEKKMKKLQKVLRQIDELKAKQESGVQLEKTQEGKMEREEQLRAELAELESSCAAGEYTTAPPVVQQESTRQQQQQQPVPGANPGDAAPRPMMSKAALKNEKRKAARAKEKEGNPVEEEIDKVAQLAAAIGMAPKVSAPVVMSKDEPTPPPPPAPQIDAAPPQATNEKEPNEVEKKVRALRKKLRAVDDLIAKQASGAELNADQLSKVAARGELLTEISRWETLGDPEELSKEVKKLAKKLRQIEELEERATKGETLNADQLGKVAQKEKVTSEHSKLAELLGAKS